MARLPADLLWVEWTRGQNQGAEALGRSHSLYIYSRNLLDHLGAKSSFSVRVDRLPFPRCFDSMADVWSLDPRERFKQVGKEPLCSQTSRVDQRPLDCCTHRAVSSHAALATLLKPIDESPASVDTCICRGADVLHCKSAPHSPAECMTAAVQGACPNSDLSPCPGGDGGESWTRHPIQWPTEIDDDEIDHPSPVPTIEQSDATQ